jgi:hypothetical protein
MRPEQAIGISRRRLGKKRPSLIFPALSDPPMHFSVAFPL